MVVQHACWHVVTSLLCIGDWIFWRCEFDAQVAQFVFLHVACWSEWACRLFWARHAICVWSFGRGWTWALRLRLCLCLWLVVAVVVIGAYWFVKAVWSVRGIVLRAHHVRSRPFGFGIGH